jgi:hypothetical protein
MLKFFNKEGKKVMEMNDAGNVDVLSEELKNSFNEEKPLPKKKEDQENE